MPDESELLLVESGVGKTHIVDPAQLDLDNATTFCQRPVQGNGEFGHPHREDLEPAGWYGDGERRQRTLADQRANQGHLLGVCKRCLKNAGVTS